MDNIYGEYLPTLERVRDELVRRFTAYHDWMLEETGDSGYEHILARIKSDESTLVPYETTEEINRERTSDTE